MVIRRYNIGFKNIKLQRLKNGGVVMNTVERYCTVSESLEESLKQMKQIRDGVLPKKTWREYREEKRLKQKQ